MGRGLAYRAVGEIERRLPGSCSTSLGKGVGLLDLSKDLCVLRRAAEVFQGLPVAEDGGHGVVERVIDRFLLQLDFVNKAGNQEKLCLVMIKNSIEGATVP